MRKPGFTFIDLIILMATISVLSVVVLPNFLESQVRSRVASCKKDLRRVAIALEAYNTDQMSYPTYHYTYYDYAGQTVAEWFLGGRTVSGGAPSIFDGNPQITTPIAYIESLPSDPFHIPESDDPPDTRSFMYVNWPYAFRNDPGNSAFAAIMRMYGAWRLTSAGPDLSRHDIMHITYDPTNGTISAGQINRTQRNPEGHPIDPW